MKKFIKEVFSTKNLREVMLLVGLSNPRVNYRNYVDIKNSINELNAEEVAETQEMIQELREVA